jgi:hypothetical protein
MTVWMPSDGLLLSSWEENWSLWLCQTNIWPRVWYQHSMHHAGNVLLPKVSWAVVSSLRCFFYSLCNLTCLTINCCSYYTCSNVALKFQDGIVVANDTHTSVSGDVNNKLACKLNVMLDETASTTRCIIFWLASFTRYGVNSGSCQNQST